MTAGRAPSDLSSETSVSSHARGSNVTQNQGKTQRVQWVIGHSLSTSDFGDDNCILKLLEYNPVINTESTGQVNWYVRHYSLHYLSVVSYLPSTHISMFPISLTLLAPILLGLPEPKRGKRGRSKRERKIPNRKKRLELWPTFLWSATVWV